MKLFKFKKNKYKLLEEKIKDLEERIFNKKKEDGSYSSIMGFHWWGHYEPITLEEEISILQDKVDALAKTMKVSLVETDAKEPEWKAKKVTKRKKS